MVSWNRGTSLSPRTGEKRARRHLSSPARVLELARPLSRSISALASLAGAAPHGCSRVPDHHLLLPGLLQRQGRPPLPCHRCCASARGLREERPWLAAALPP